MKSCIGKNIRKIRGYKGLSQKKFAELFNLTRTAVGSYEEERAEPKISAIIEIANYFGISIDALLTKELTVNDIANFDIFRDTEPQKIRKIRKSKSEKQILLEDRVKILEEKMDKLMRG